MLVDDTGTTGTTYSDRGLTAGTTRHYRVCALNSAGIGPPSNIIGAVTNLAPPEVTVRAVQSPVVEGTEVAFTLRACGRHCRATHGVAGSDGDGADDRWRIADLGTLPWRRR